MWKTNKLKDWKINGNREMSSERPMEYWSTEKTNPKLENMEDQQKNMELQVNSNETLKYWK